MEQSDSSVTDVLVTKKSINWWKVGVLTVFYAFLAFLAFWNFSGHILQFYQTLIDDDSYTLSEPLISSVTQVLDENNIRYLLPDDKTYTPIFITDTRYPL